MVKKSILAQRVLYGVARECDLEALGKDEVLAIKRDKSVVHHRFLELPFVTEEKAAGADDEEKREFIDYASTEHVDGMGDVIKVAGWDTLRLKVGSVPLFWGHDSSPVPMGRVQRAKRDKYTDGVRALVTTSNVYEEELYGDSEWGKHVASIVALMQRGDMPGRSVGFIPKDIRWPEQEEREELGMGKWGVIFEAQELYELSVTPIPCNPYANEKKSLDRIEAALREMVGAKTITADFAEWFKKALARGEEEFIEKLGARTIVPLSKELPWLKGGDALAGAPARGASPSESALRALVREEMAAVSQSAIAPVQASMVRLEQRIAELGSSVPKPKSHTDENRGETESREAPCPPTERSTGTSRAADPIAFQRAVLEVAVRDLTTTQGPDHGPATRSARAAEGQPAQGAAGALAEA